MAVRRSTLSVAAAALAAIPVLAQGPAPPPAPVRDPGAIRTQRMPVGNGSISGTVVSEGGEPIRNARIMLNGSTTSAATSPVGRGGVEVIGRSGVLITPAPGIAPAGASLNRTTVTDDRGRFSIANLPAGQFTLIVTHDLYLQTSYGQKEFGRPPGYISLADGQRFSAPVRMYRGGVIAGTVYGENNEPLVRASVRAMRYAWYNGVRRATGGGGGSTDDRGAFRLFGLQPGDYVISATAFTSSGFADQAAAQSAAFDEALAAARAAAARSGAPPPAFVNVPVPTQPIMVDGAPTGLAQTFHPSSPNPAGATIIPINAGETREGVDVRILPIRTSNVTVSVVGETPAGTRIQVNLVSAEPSMDGFPSSGQVTPEGKVILRNVPPGQYTAIAQTMLVPQQMPTPVTPGTPPPPPQRLADSARRWGQTEITVDGQPNVAATVVLGEGRSISGLVLFEGTGAGNLLSRDVTISLVAAPSARMIPQYGTLPQAPLGADGRFALNGVTPGRYTLRTSVGQPRSVSFNGQEILDFPLEFTGADDVSGIVVAITDRLAQMTGVVKNSAGQPVWDRTVVLAAADSRYWTVGSRRIRIVRPDGLGRYSVGGLPAGDYLLATVDYVEQGAQFNREVLTSLLREAERITIADAAQIVRDITVR